MRRAMVILSFGIAVAVSASWSETISLVVEIYAKGKTRAPIPEPCQALLDSPAATVADEARKECLLAASGWEKLPDTGLWIDPYPSLTAVGEVGYLMVDFGTAVDVQRSRNAVAPPGIAQ